MQDRAAVFAVVRWVRMLPSEGKEARRVYVQLVQSREGWALDYI